MDCSFEENVYTIACDSDLQKLGTKMDMQKAKVQKWQNGDREEVEANFW